MYVLYHICMYVVPCIVDGVMELIRKKRIQFVQFRRSGVTGTKRSSIGTRVVGKLPQRT